MKKAHHDTIFRIGIYTATVRAGSQIMLPDGNLFGLITSKCLTIKGSQWWNSTSTALKMDVEVDGAP